MPDDPLDPSFGADLGAVSIEELRRRRAVADERETACSYLRRMVQARLDIVGAERARRAAGEPAGDISDLVDRLPGILGEHVHAPGRGRLSQLMAPGDTDPVLQQRLDAILANADLAALPALDEGELGRLQSELESFEQEVSGVRRQLHTLLDSMSSEVVRRYRDGEARPDDLL